MSENTSISIYYIQYFKFYIILISVFSRRRFGFGEKEDSNYGGETKEEVPV